MAAAACLLLLLGALLPAGARPSAPSLGRRLAAPPGERGPSPGPLGAGAGAATAATPPAGGFRAQVRACHCPSTPAGRPEPYSRFTAPCSP